jgi:hypothetical protein
MFIAVLALAGWKTTPAQAAAQPAAYVGLRRSSYGGKAHNADDAWWAARAKEYAANFPGAKPCIIEIVGNYQGVSTDLGFSKPATYTGPTEDMRFRPGGIDHERALSLYDKEGVCAVIQFEPGDADVAQCIEAAHQAFGQHPCIIDYGIDGEWYRTTH